MEEDLSKEFAKVARITKKQIKENEIAEIRENILNATERDFQTMKQWMLMLFDQNIYLQSMLEQSVMNNILGIYPSEE